MTAAAMADVLHALPNIITPPPTPSSASEDAVAGEGLTILDPSRHLGSEGSDYLGYGGLGEGAAQGPDPQMLQALATALEPHLPNMDPDALTHAVVGLARCVWSGLACCGGKILKKRLAVSLSLSEYQFWQA